GRLLDCDFEPSAHAGRRPRISVLIEVRGLLRLKIRALGSGILLRSMDPPLCDRICPQVDVWEPKSDTIRPQRRPGREESDLRGGRRERLPLRAVDALIRSPACTSVVRSLLAPSLPSPASGGGIR